MPDIVRTNGIGIVPNLDSVSGRFLSALDNCFVSQCVFEPTFQNAADVTGGSILDFILTDSAERVLDVVLSPPIGRIQMAHAVINWKLAIGGSKKVMFRTKRNWNKGKYKEINTELSGVKWADLFDSNALDTCYEFFFVNFS